MERKNYAIFMAIPGNDFSNKILKGAIKAAKELDVNLFIFPVGIVDGDFADKELSAYMYQYTMLSDFSKAPSIDGAIVEFGTIASEINDVQKKQLLEKFHNMPIVLMTEDSPGYESVLLDNQSGIREGIRHMVEDHGYRKIGFVSGPLGNQDSMERLAVYQECVEKYNLPVTEDWIAVGNFSTYCIDVISKLMDAHPDMEAIVFANDDMATAGYRVAAKKGLVVGEDIFFIGFDDSSSAILQDPPLSTVRLEPELVAYKAMYKLVNKVETEKIETKFIPRVSCGCRDKLIYNKDGDVIGTESHFDMLRVSKEKIDEVNNAQLFFREVELVGREMVYYQRSRESWMNAVLNSLRRLGCKRSYLFFYPEEIFHTGLDEWIMPEKINLVAYAIGDKNTCFEHEGESYGILDIFDSSIVASQESYQMLVTPLFFREKHFGLLFAECDEKQHPYVIHMLNELSSTIEMIHIREKNEQIQKELEAANNAKSQFLANMSHEIRTPINAVIGMNEMVLRESQDQKITEYANYIKNASETLLYIVNDILDFSKIEAQKMTIVPVDYELKTLLDDVIRQLQFRADDKQIELKLELDENLPCVVWGDDIRVRQVLINLLSNGVKYTNEGSVTLIVTGEAVGDKVRVKFQVKDTGIGIKKEDLSKLYEKFQRIEENRNRNIEGTGLGMNIAVGLIELMGGHLVVESRYGEGSVFSFEIEQGVKDATPIRKFATEKPKEDKAFVQSYIAPDAKILVVDDNRVNRIVVEKLLSKSQMQIDLVASGMECLEKMNQTTYDLVLLDHMMPQMDGIETFERIKELANYEKGKPGIVILTANAIQGAKEFYLENGFDGYLSKPIQLEELDRVILRFVSAEKIRYMD